MSLCALRDTDHDMTLYACGSNASAQLALGHADDVHVLCPTACDPSVPAGRAIDLASASTHALALYRLDDDTGGPGGRTILLGCGTNTAGQLGGQCALWGARPEPHWKTADLRPLDMRGEGGWEPAMIASAWTTSYVVYRRESVDGSAALNAAGGAASAVSAAVQVALVSAGSNDFGELGHGHALPSPASAHPARIELDLHAGEDVALLRAGQRHALIVLRGPRGDRVVGWGASRRGELDAAPGGARSSAKGKGKAAARPAVSGPTGIAVDLAGRRVVDAALGAAHTVLLLDDHTLRAWGHDGRGQIAGLDVAAGVRAIATSWNGTYILDDRGLSSQGANTHNQLLQPGQSGDDGGGSTDGSDGGRRPVNLPEGFDVDAVVAGTEHVVLVGRQGGRPALYTGGWNEHGNLGVGDTAERRGLVPLRVPGAEAARAYTAWAGCAATWALVLPAD